ncbi:hypothetical protein OHS33_38960 (plasmid) [Streptomyces sp. NBC_00536]|uniref:hypothetical protein n=1 Tax=Streptomyces sp. NBC_00536 TaxID=2975769 RepID=UPI002E7FDFB1|nr:hypothetical protein [Streptomyces sp. NBC_00536]WUC84339.1 hypothetical protein OHS33_38960 [Streptomyces sp. NBC_00536]
MADYAKELQDEGLSGSAARLTVRRMRSAEVWPTLNLIVQSAIECRLAEDDLAGPWAPLTQDEEELATLSGRGVGRHYPGSLVSRTYELPYELVKALKTAAVRVSEAPLAKLEEVGLTYQSLDYTAEQQEQRDELLTAVHSVARIVRQGLERYGPWPREEIPPSAPQPPDGEISINLDRR